MSEHAIKRQAVIVIHGMGEQRPMDTLREFVAGVKSILDLSGEEERLAVVRSKPDSIGDIYETVRLSMSRTSKRPITDFYEFYWAHNFRDSKASQMWTWMKKLLLTSPGKTPPRLRKLWYTVWSIILTTAGLAYFFWPHFTGWNEQYLGPLIAIPLVSLLLSFIATTFTSGFVNSAGDAARYFTPKPENISERSNIRRQGISFLKKLHDIQTFEKVDRIIIVAHSLGSVVAYDLLRLLWTEHNIIYNKVPNVHQPELDSINKFSDKDAIKTNEDLTAFRQLQYKCWQEQCNVGNPWRISDFITLGAALHAIDYLMVSNVSAETMKRDRELPVCPPVQDEVDKKIYYNSYPPFKVGVDDHKLKLLNHAALFAVTRWTNIFYSSDFVGGPMNRLFGKGVKDIMVKRKGLWFLPGGHTEYWKRNKGKTGHPALKALVEQMNLNT